MQKYSPWQCIWTTVWIFCVWQDVTKRDGEDGTPGCRAKSSEYCGLSGTSRMLWCIPTHKTCFSQIQAHLEPVAKIAFWFTPFLATFSHHHGADMCHKHLLASWSVVHFTTDLYVLFEVTQLAKMISSKLQMATVPSTIHVPSTILFHTVHICPARFQP